MKKQIAIMLRAARVSNSLKSHGIECKHVRHLDRMTNIQTCWGGHLKDATCHYSRRMEYSGKTYHVRKILSAEGYKWDGQKKVWWVKLSDWDTETSARIIRACEAAAQVQVVDTNETYGFSYGEREAYMAG